MRLGVITDVHLAPADTPAAGWHNQYHFGDAAARFAHALQRCTEAQVDAIAVVGDLSHLGDGPSLRAGVQLAAHTGVPVLLVPGNHDVTAHTTALDAALTQLGAPHVRLVPLDGATVAGVRLAGVSALAASTWFDARATMLPSIAAWNRTQVVYLTHYPVLSLAAEVAAAKLQYPGDLVNRDAVATPLLARRAPTVVVHGHVHVRAVVVADAVLQLGCGPLIEPPFDVTILEVRTSAEQTTVQVQRIAVTELPAVRLPVLAPPTGAWHFTNGQWHTTTTPDG